MVGINRNPFAQRAEPQMELELLEEAVESHESSLFETIGGLLTGIVTGDFATARRNTGATSAAKEQVMDGIFNGNVAHLPASTTTRMSKRRMRRLRGKAKAA